MTSFPLHKHFQPHIIVMNFRTQFYNRKQNYAGSEEKDASTVCSLAVRCQFAEHFTQTDMMKDRLLSSMWDSLLSAELRLDKNVTLVIILWHRQKHVLKKLLEIRWKLRQEVAWVRSNTKQQYLASSTAPTGNAKASYNTQNDRGDSSCRYWGGGRGSTDL